jgi:hypothetical protein
VSVLWHHVRSVWWRWNSSEVIHEYHIIFVEMTFLIEILFQNSNLASSVGVELLGRIATDETIGDCAERGKQLEEGSIVAPTISSICTRLMEIVHRDDV